MSSGPVGLDTREYVFAHYSLTLTNPVGFYIVSARKNWLVTRVQFYAATDPAQIALDTLPAIPVAANGCLVLEPNGAFKGRVNVSGGGALLIVEYWFQTIADTVVGQSIPIDLVSPP